MYVFAKKVQSGVWLEDLWAYFSGMSCAKGYGMSCLVICCDLLVLICFGAVVPRTKVRMKCG